MDASDFATAKVLSQNLKALLKHGHGPSTQMDLAARSGIAQATIGRILRAETSATIDTVAKIAKAYGLEAWQLLVAGMAPHNPPVLRTISPEEQALYERLRGAAELLAQMPTGKYGKDPRK